MVGMESAGVAMVAAAVVMVVAVVAVWPLKAARCSSCLTAARGEVFTISRVGLVSVVVAVAVSVAVFLAISNSVC